MTRILFALAVLAVGASLAPAFAFPGSGGRTGDDPVQARVTALSQTSATIEGRQATILATGPTAGETYVVDRNFNESHNR